MVCTLHKITGVHEIVVPDCKAWETQVVSGAKHSLQSLSLNDVQWKMRGTPFSQDVVFFRAETAAFGGININILAYKISRQRLYLSCSLLRNSPQVVPGLFHSLYHVIQTVLHVIRLTISPYCSVFKSSKNIFIARTNSFALKSKVQEVVEDIKGLPFPVM